MRGPMRVLLAAAFSTAPFPHPSQGSTSPLSRSADAWYDEAIEATLAGDASLRERALDAAVEVDPEHAPSRGERGEVKFAGRWVSAAYAQELAEQSPEREEYVRRRAEMRDTPAEHARMAKWCGRAGLAEEARPHWLAVLAADPENAAALEGLGSVWRGGRLVEREVADDRDQQTQASRRTAEDWEKRFRRFERRPYLDAEELAAIRADLDADALGPIERRLAALVGGGGGDRVAALADAFLGKAPEIPGEEVTALLCRVAVFGSEERSDRAVEGLKQRPQEDVMPMLLECLAAPIETRHEVVQDARGNVAYSHRFEQKGDQKTRVHETSRVTRVGVNVFNPRVDGYATFTTDRSIYEAMVAAKLQGLRAYIEYQQTAVMTEELVAAYNQGVEESNRRVAGVLSQVAGRSLGDGPSEWWDYWRRETGYDDYVRPTERTYDIATRQRSVTSDPTFVRLPPPPPLPRCECFVAGTPVWTRDGKQAIETLKKGDLVLARDPHRGGLVYRVVTDTTVREPSPMVAIALGDETIRATVGHPFWVVGQGWRMAKELVAGDVLSTVDGPVTVEAIDDQSSQPAYNLVVEGAANYYVGERGVLVHDNTPRVPAVGLVARR